LPGKRKFLPKIRGGASLRRDLGGGKDPAPPKCRSREGKGGTPTAILKEGKKEKVSIVPLFLGDPPRLIVAHWPEKKKRGEKFEDF